MSLFRRCEQLNTQNISRIKQHTSTVKQAIKHKPYRCVFITAYFIKGGSVAEWLACWTLIAAATLSGNSLTQTVHTHRASVHQAAKLVAALLRVAGVTVGLAESNGSLPRVWATFTF